MARKVLLKPEYTRHAAIKAVPTLLDRLSFEHRQIRHLWVELQRAHNEQVFGRYAPDAQRVGETRQHELSRRLVEVVIRHEAIERDALYPIAARAMSDTWVDDAKAAHTDIHDLLEEVVDQDPEDESVYAIFSEVLPRLLAHAGEEETILFPIMRLVMSKEELVNPPEDETTEFVILSRCERLPSLPHRFALPPAPPAVIDLAAAEREAATVPTANGHAIGSGHADGAEHDHTDGPDTADQGDGAGGDVEAADIEGHAAGAMRGGDEVDGNGNGNGNGNGSGHREKKLARLLRR